MYLYIIKLTLNLQALMDVGGNKTSALMAKKAPTMPKPQWHPPWKLYRVSSKYVGKVNLRIRTVLNAL